MSFTTYKICRYHPHDVYQFLLLCRRISRLRPHPCKRPFNDFYRATIEDGHTQYEILEVLTANPQTMVAVSRDLILSHVQANGLGFLIPSSTFDVTIPFCPTYQRPVLDSTSHLLPPFRPTLPKNTDCARADVTNCLPRCQSAVIQLQPHPCANAVKIIRQGSYAAIDPVKIFGLKKGQCLHNRRVQRHPAHHSHRMLKNRRCSSGYSTSLWLFGLRKGFAACSKECW